MRYKNKKTGVTINVTSEISGGDWVPVDRETKKEVETVEDDQNVEEQEVEEQEASEQEAEEFVEEEVDLNDMTNEQLDALAKDQGIKLTTKDKKNKETRIAAIVQAFE